MIQRLERQFQISHHEEQRKTLKGHAEKIKSLQKRNVTARIYFRFSAEIRKKTTDALMRRVTNILCITGSVAQDISNAFFFKTCFRRRQTRKSTAKITKLTTRLKNPGN